MARSNPTVTPLPTRTEEVGLYRALFCLFGVGGEPEGSRITYMWFVVVTSSLIFSWLPLLRSSGTGLAFTDISMLTTDNVDGPPVDNVKTLKPVDTPPLYESTARSHSATALSSLLADSVLL